MGVAEIVVEEGSGDELELVPLDEGGDFCGEMLAEERGGVGRVREAFFEELVVWLLEILGGHGSAERIECRDAVTSKSAVCDMIAGWPHAGNLCGASQASL